MNETKDEFLNGRIRVVQPANGFRAGTDTVLLAAAIPATRDEQILELGVGSGVALCCLGARVEELALHGVEIDAGNVKRAKRNLVANGLAGEIYHGDALAPDANLRQRQFDHVLMNPPYFNYESHSAPENREKSLANITYAPLSNWVRAGCKRTRPKGSLTVIAPAEALSELLSGLYDMGNVRVLPVAPRAGAPAKRVLMQAVRQSRAPIRLLAPFVNYGEEGQPTARAEAIARHGEALHELHLVTNPDVTAN